MAVGPSHPKSSLHSLSVFSIKSSSTSSSSSSSSSSSNLSFSSKLKTVVQTFILSHLYRIARALTKAKSLVIEVLKDIQLLHFMEISIKKNKNKNKLFLGSFRMHYNWCSSHVVPVPMPVLQGNNNYYSSTSSSDHLYYDSTWNTIISTESEETEDSSDLSGYLHWLEQKAHHVQDPTSTTTAKGHANDIDRLADMFIANSHEKFRLEKQESYRRFQEMMARSV